MPGQALEVRPGLRIPADEIHETASRSGGPGGQHVNKTETRVTLRWNVAESRALGEDHRRRLVTRLASRLTNRGHLVVHAQRERRLDAKRRRSTTKRGRVRPREDAP
jgi:ribosome-associated protein